MAFALKDDTDAPIFYGFVREDFPGAMDYCARRLTLPLFPTVDAAQFDRICNAPMDWAAMQ